MNTYDQMMAELQKTIPNPMWESAVAREAVRFLCKRIDEIRAELEDIQKRIPPHPPAIVNFDEETPTGDAG